MPQAVVITPTGYRVCMLEGYEQVSAAVGGPLEAIKLRHDAHAYIHEDGKLAGLAANRNAMRLLLDLRVNLQPGDYIAGTMVIFGSLNSVRAFDGEEHDCPSDLVGKASRMFLPAECAR